MAPLALQLQDGTWLRADQITTVEVQGAEWTYKPGPGLPDERRGYFAVKVQPLGGPEPLTVATHETKEEAEATRDRIAHALWDPE